MKLSLGAEGAFWEWVEALTEEGEALLGEKPTIDLGLALLSRSLGCTPGTAWTLFALGRTVGWIAHFLEERRRDRLIRPRARYTGPPVPPTSKTA
jgi:citrate synthase